VVVSFSMFFLCIAALLMTGSRAGVVLSLLALVVAFTLYFRRDLPKKNGLIAAVLASAGIALVLLQFVGAGVSSRFDVEGLSAAGRLETYRSTLRMISDYPWWGTGLGSFAWAYPAYRSPNLSLWGTWDRAHNTLLEIASDMGVPLAALIVIGWLVVLVVLIRGVRAQRAGPIVPLAALCITILALLHSLVDFSLQIQGFAIVAFAIVGAGLSQSLFSQSPSTP
jgi:O-antigen ligase